MTDLRSAPFKTDGDLHHQKYKAPHTEVGTEIRDDAANPYKREKNTGKVGWTNLECMEGDNAARSSPRKRERNEEDWAKEKKFVHSIT